MARRTNENSLTPGGEDSSLCWVITSRRRDRRWWSWPGRRGAAAAGHGCRRRHWSPVSLPPQLLPPPPLQPSPPPTAAAAAAVKPPPPPPLPLLRACTAAGPFTRRLRPLSAAAAAVSDRGLQFAGHVNRRTHGDGRSQWSETRWTWSTVLCCLNITDPSP
ncbi:MAG: hypothetical protein R3F62_08525 [Planctomycetota bacterium]